MRPLFGLAPGGVYHARDVTAPAVGSYPTLSPLLRTNPERSALCGTFPRLSPGGRYPPPCFHGARTFLQHNLKGYTSDCPAVWSGRPYRPDELASPVPIYKPRNREPASGPTVGNQMIKTSLTTLALASGLFVAACSPSDEPAMDTQADTETPIVDAQDSGVETQSDALLPDDTDETNMGVTGDDAGLSTLQPVTAEDVSMLEGELACSFATSDESNTLLVARADVSENGRATAAINSDGFAMQLYGEQLGGFSGLEEDGGTFAGEGMVIVVELGDAALGGSETEQSSQVATMTVNRADGATRTFDGEWVCGP